jgi:S1-C subfamily serine protease
MNCRKLAIQIGLLLLSGHLAIDCMPVFAQIEVVTADAQNRVTHDSFGFDNTPTLNVANGMVDNSAVYMTFLGRGTRLIESGHGLSLSEITASLESKRNPAVISIPEVGIRSTERLYDRMLDASMLIGTIYDCGKCSKMHANIAGGVLVSSDGLVLTNYHVVERTEEGVRGLVTMSHDGRVWPIVEVIAASKTDDVALIRIETDGSLKPCPVATSEPPPLTPVHVISQPHNEYFVLTEGVVSRHVRVSPRQGQTRWLEITAEFAAGSSGSGVFDNEGRLVGLVSRVHPIIRDGNKPDETEPQPSREKPAYAEMVLRRCVPVSAILRCFAEPADPETRSGTE